VTTVKAAHSGARHPAASTDSQDAGAPEAPRATHNRRPAVVRAVDPFDLAGTAVRSVLPQHTTPPVAHAAYYLTLAGLVAAEVVDLPVALLLGVGHALLQTRNPTLEQVAEGFDAAG